LFIFALRFTRKVLYSLFLFLTDFYIQLVIHGLLVLFIFLLFCFRLRGKFASYTSTKMFKNSLYAFTGSFCFIQNIIPGKGFNCVFEHLCVNNVIKCFLVCYVTNIFGSVFTKYICIKHIHYWKWSEISLKIIPLTLSPSFSRLLVKMLSINVAVWWVILVGFVISGKKDDVKSCSIKWLV
jgi:hypothetical protein